MYKREQVPQRSSASASHSAFTKDRWVVTTASNAGAWVGRPDRRGCVNPAPTPTAASFLIRLGRVGFVPRGGQPPPPRRRRPAAVASWYHAHLVAMAAKRSARASTDGVAKWLRTGDRVRSVAQHDDGWTCTFCGRRHSSETKDAQFLACALCGTERAVVPSSPEPAPLSPESTTAPRALAPSRKPAVDDSSSGLQDELRHSDTRQCTVVSRGKPATPGASACRSINEALLKLPSDPAVVDGVRVTDAALAKRVPALLHRHTLPTALADQLLRDLLLESKRQWKTHQWTVYGTRHDAPRTTAMYDLTRGADASVLAQSSVERHQLSWLDPPESMIEAARHVEAMVASRCPSIRRWRPTMVLANRSVRPGRTTVALQRVVVRLFR